MADKPLIPLDPQPEGLPFSAEFQQTIIQMFHERMVITGAVEGPTNIQIVATTNANDLQTVYDDLNKTLYTDHSFTTYGVTEYLFVNSDTVIHQFTFNVGDYRNEPQP